jgi:hypothetical protein
LLRRLLLVLLQELEQVPVPLLVQEQVLLPELEQVLPLLLVQELRPDLLLQLHM